MSINSCYEDISKYNSMKSNLHNVVNSLNNSSNKVSPLANSITAVYNMNDNSTPIVQKCVGLHKDIVGTSNFITNTIIPAIDDAIRGKRQEIARIEAENRRREEEERRRREEAKRNAENSKR